MWIELATWWNHWISLWEKLLTVYFYNIWYIAYIWARHMDEATYENCVQVWSPQLPYERCWHIRKLVQSSQTYPRNFSPTISISPETLNICIISLPLQACRYVIVRRQCWKWFKTELEFYYQHSLLNNYNTQQNKFAYTYVCTYVCDFKLCSQIICTCNSCNMGKSGLPDIYTRSLRVYPLYIYQASHECPCYNYYVPLSYRLQTCVCNK